MNKLYHWLLLIIARRAVIQGNHKHNITEFYKCLYQAAVEEFTEDNKPTLDAFLCECHRLSLQD